jgi:hypothetical protein
LFARRYPGVDPKELSEEISRRRRKEDLVPDQLVTEAIKYEVSLKLLLSKSELEAALKEMHASVDKESQLFLNRPESLTDNASWGHWLRMTTWTSSQATALSLSRNPERVTLEIARKFEKQSAFARTFIARHDLVYNAIISGTLLVTPTVAQSGACRTLIPPKNLALWANDLDLDVPDEIKGLIEDRREPQGFKDMESLNWGEITLTLLGAGHIKVSVRSVTENIPLANLGLLNRTTNKPNRSFAILVMLVEASRSPIKYNPQLQNAVYRLRKALKGYFGIKKSPILFESDRYVAAFQLVDKRNAADERAKEKGIRRTSPLDESSMNPGYTFDSQDLPDDDPGTEYLKKYD